MFRFRNYGKRQIDISAIDRSIEPRLAQVFGPLLAVVKNPNERDALAEVAREYHRELVADRGTDMEAQILTIIRCALKDSDDGQVSIKEISRRFAREYGDEYDRRITPKWIGSVIRRSLQLKTQKSHGVFIISPGEKVKLEKTLRKV